MILRSEFDISEYLLYNYYIITYNLISSGGGNVSGPCSETYPGPAPFSDIEIKSIRIY